MGRLRELPAALLLLLASSNIASGFYLPGITPTNYKENDLVPLNVNHLSSPRRSAFAFDYYYDAFRTSPSRNDITTYTHL